MRTPGANAEIEALKKAVALAEKKAAAEQALGVPHYESVAEGPDHARVFTSRVRLSGEVRGIGTGSAKKHAEQQAAEAAYRWVTGQDA